VKKFPGKRTFMRYANFGVFEAALLADGVAKDKLYPLDVDRALKKLDQIKDHILWFDSGAQMTQYFSDGSVSVGMGWDGRICVIAKDNVPVAYSYDQSLISYSSFIIPRGAPNRTTAMKFLGWVIGRTPQAKIAEAICYGPVNPQAFQLIPSTVQATLSGNPTERPLAVFMDTKYWAENLASVQQRFDAWLAT
jgi:putative spermidine/putrescine transport system substrate-binding protein